MKFKEYLSNAWSTHATDPKAVADEFKQNFNLMESEDDVMAMTRLIVHVCGTHLGEWTRGIELLRKLKNNAPIKDPSEMNRLMAILNLGNNPNTTIENFSPSDQVIIYASTASALASLGGLKVAEKFLKMASEITDQQLNKEDLAFKALGMAGNNIVQTFEEKKEMSENEIAIKTIAEAVALKYKT